MKSNTIDRLFQQANALQLLRDNKAVMILDFLQSAYSDGRKSIGQEELTNLLADYLDQTHDEDSLDELESTEPNANLFDKFRNRAKALLRDWESRDKRYLRGDNNAEGRYEYSLTEHVTRAWQWLDNLEQKEFAGARSRLDDIFEKIKRVVENSREKTDAERIEELEEKQVFLKQEITDIRAGKAPYRPFDAVRVQEEYDGLLEQLRALSTDFKVVESNFERIRTDILRRQAAQEGTKGALLGNMLDARDELDRTAQGVSFNAFFEELRDPMRQKQFADNVQALIEVLEIHQIPHPNDRLMTRLHKHLLEEAKPVLEANRRIADRISRLVTENATHDRKLLKERIAAIKAAVLSPELLSQPIDPTAIVWEIDTDRADIQLPLERTLRTHQEEGSVRFSMPQAMTESRPDFELESEELIAQRLQAQITAALDEFGQMTLAELVKKHPVSEGLAEVLTYLSIVAQPDNSHFIQTDQEDLLPMEAEKQLKGARVFLVK
jgi:hypothetical protein